MLYSVFFIGVFMSEYHFLSSYETKMLDEYFIANLENMNKKLNIDIHSLNEHHFYHALDSLFPTWRSEQLYNNGNNIAYLSYIQNLGK